MQLLNMHKANLNIFSKGLKIHQRGLKNIVDPSKFCVTDLNFRISIADLIVHVSLNN